MRPTELNPLFAPITVLRGIGPTVIKYFQNLLSYNMVGRNLEREPNPKIVDLLYHFPYSVTDRTKTVPLYEAKSGDLITCVVKVEQYIKPERRGKPFRVLCYSPRGYITLVFFKVYEDYIMKNLKVGEEIAISGKVDVFRDGLQMVHPDYIVPANDIDKIKLIDRNYPLTAGLNGKLLRKVQDLALRNLPDLPEWIDESVVRQEGWVSWKESIFNLHHPKIDPTIDLNNKYRRRLAYDELLANQIAMRLVKNNIKKAVGRPVKIDRGENSMWRKLLAGLHFELTGDQKRVLDEIYADLESPTKMLRLLQGDVGSGKTIVALLAMLAVVEDGKQAVMMAPTSILANQLYEVISKFCEPFGVHVGFLTGKVKGKKRENVLEDLKNGDIDILIGTHALIQDWVEFRDLALVVIDEQHRFGVLQRAVLAKKGNAPDVLLMTATPIPRTLTLTIYGDIDVSTIKEKPATRKLIETRVVSSNKISEVIGGIKRVLENGEKVYWVCPLVEESEELDLNAVEQRFEEFKKEFGADVVGLVHGKLKADAKDKVMEDFASVTGRTKILVATTVVEVGVDVSDATIMIIENTERFGLCQLHQLRGRVGRGEKKSYCILMYRGLSETSKRRLNVMRETNDGFVISEEDLKIRGAGEVLGTKQSGFKDYKIANLNVDYDLLSKASQDARLFLQKDSSLATSRGKNIKMLLYLFGYNECIEVNG